MEPDASQARPAAAAHRAFWPAWLLSIAALAVAVVPGAGPWAALLFALASAQWAWLAYRGAAAGGDDGKSLRDLIAASSRAAGDDVRALRADLARVRGLVHDAVVTLGNGFHGVGDRLRGEDRIIAVLRARMLAEPSALDRVLSEELARISAADSGDSLESLTRALQFEDVVRQLLEYCDRQAAGVETFIDGLAGLLPDAQPGQHPEERRAELARACRSYLENSLRCADDRQRHITQTSMRAGEVELF